MIGREPHYVDKPPEKLPILKAIIFPWTLQFDPYLKALNLKICTMSNYNASVNAVLPVNQYS